MDVLVKVYLNEGPDHWAGFHNTFSDDPRLRMATAFIVPVLEIDTMPSTKYPGWFLDKVFEQLNVGGDLVDAEPWTTQYRAEGNRSLSVGDVVVVDGVPYSCESVGWKVAERDDVTAAVSRFIREGEYVR